MVSSSPALYVLHCVVNKCEQSSAFRIEDQKESVDGAFTLGIEERCSFCAPMRLAMPANIPEPLPRTRIWIDLNRSMNELACLRKLRFKRAVPAGASIYCQQFFEKAANLTFPINEVDLQNPVALLAFLVN
jgi:hypothetical protein